MTDLLQFLAYAFDAWSLALAVALTISLCGFVYATAYARFDIADVLWGVGIASAGCLLLWSTGFTHTAAYVLCACLALWGARIVVHIGSRFISKQTEDARYAQWRREWKRPHVRGFLQIFLLQGVLMTIVVSPAIAYATWPGEIPLWQLVLGGSVWLIGFVFETVGDWQLKQFIKDPSRYGLERGDLMTRGLWALTRHPNYFGEMTMWWGVAILALHTWYLPYVAILVVGPMTITYLLRFVSGVPKTEEHWAEKYGEKYEQYKQSTPALVPFTKWGR